MEQVSVRFQATPNPNAGKFVLDRQVLEGGGSRSYTSSAHAADDVLARALFALDGVAGLFMVSDFVTVTKTPAADWRTLAPLVEQTIQATLT